MNKIVKDTIALTLITLVAGILLGFVYEITKEPIAIQQEAGKQAAYQEVFQDASTFETVIEGADPSLQDFLTEVGYAQQTINKALKAMDKDGEVLGYVFTVTSKEGYGGDITLVMGVRMDGTTNGYSILSINETPGLGMKADSSEFKSQFQNINVQQFEYTKTGATSDGEIDVISGATITTNAVVNGVNAGLHAFTYLEGGH